jgi:hypothetical protein
MAKYNIIRKSDETVVDTAGTRKRAREIKKAYEVAAQVETGSQNRPSAFYIETGVHNPNGAGIYIH